MGKASNRGVEPAADCEEMFLLLMNNDLLKLLGVLIHPPHQVRKHYEQNQTEPVI